MPEGQEYDEHEMDMPSENYCDFTIFITDGDGKNGIIAEATSLDTEISINNALVTSEMDRVRKLPRFQRSINEYIGPDFTTLDERIQQSLMDYFDGYGIDEQLAAFVECMSLDKDQRMYMKWLSSVKNFI